VFGSPGRSTSIDFWRLATFPLIRRNTALPPFNDVDVRRALNFTVDRRRFIDELSGIRARPTCQILPPKTNGFAATHGVGAQVQDVSTVTQEVATPVPTAPAVTCC
jgi:ABC-type oligopeptide transport system substrate-binding subunit